MATEALEPSELDIEQQFNGAPPVEAQAVPDLPVATVTIGDTALGNGMRFTALTDAGRALPPGKYELFTRPTPAAADLHQQITQLESGAAAGRATDEQIREWAERHDLGSLSLTDLRCIFEDAQTLVPVAASPAAADLHQQSHSVHLAGDETGRTSVEAAANAPRADGSAQIVNLLRLILERLPDPSAPLGEAIEWESNDGCDRTTDPDMARNWAAAIGVTVVRRAPTVAQPVNNSGASGSPARTDDGQVNKEKPHD